jgi:hypothetical protein
MPHNPASIVRLLYGERATEEKTAAKRFLLTTANNSLTPAPPIGQGHRLPESRQCPQSIANGSSSDFPALRRSIAF